jgi:pimeloyl-ACP methyl ester carboxylesterase
MDGGSDTMSMASQALMVSPWGFDPHQIAVPSHIWGGEDDQHAPPVMARSLAETIPGADLHVMPRVGHVSVFYQHAPDILKTLVAQP